MRTAFGTRVRRDDEPDGGGQVRDAYTEVLRGAEAVVIADNDEPGLAHARTVAEALDAPIYIAAEGNDVSDHLDAGLDLDDLEEVPWPTVA
jgi:hypothetical protein